MIDDVEIARQVCHWHRMYDTWYVQSVSWIKPEKTGYVSKLMEYNTMWEPQVYLKHAWEIVTALEKDCWMWNMCRTEQGVLFNASKETTAIIGFDASPQKAICLAAMQLIEAKEREREEDDE